MKNEKRNILIMVTCIVAVTGFPFWQEGLCAYFPDLMYHMLRIEGVKDALLLGTYPTSIYTNFFDGYGYGSPMFYPDIFLVIPAMLRIINFSPLITWKIFALLITAAASLSNYFSVKYICKNAKWSMAATFMIMLSQFYLADLHLRAGISEYLAFIFIPILMAGIYDFFAYDGKKTYLMGIALVGLVLSHSIMTFIGVLITTVIFVRMAFVPKKNNYLFDRERMIRLIITAICTILVVAYYLFPMLEQMIALELKYTEPWAYIGNNVQPFSSFFRLVGRFSVIAYIGVGIPILPLIFVILFARKIENKWANAFFYGGILLFLITTDVIPWRIFENTILNMIQFTYRFWPYAIFFVVTGIVMILDEKMKMVPTQYEKVLLIVVMGSAILFGSFQNRMTAGATSEETKNITEEYLIQNSNYVGAGEWLPKNISNEIINLTASKDVLKTEEVYIYPLIYYKGYEAWMQSTTGKICELEVTASEHGLVQVANESDIEGEIRVTYSPTKIQKISTMITIITLIILASYYIRKRYFV